jgi:hypothetical protein
MRRQFGKRNSFPVDPAPLNLKIFAQVNQTGKISWSDAAKLVFTAD